MAEIQIKLDFRSKKPLSYQVQDEMRRLIEEEYLRPGDQLPTVRMLAAQLRVNFNTIARAYRVLDQEGLISTHQGRGTYILEESEAPSDQPLPTKEEQVDKLVNEMLEKAGRLDISLEELHKALQQRSEPAPFQKPKPRSRRIHAVQKRRRYSPAWYHEWTSANDEPKEITHRPRGNRGTI